jgi:superoxide dismutase, Fe-Mn family
METSRRQFCKSVAAASVVAAAGTLPFGQLGAALASSTPNSEASTMTFSLPPLPYAPTALEPHLSAKTFSFHYEKHHQAYVTNLNNLIKDTPLASQSLEDIIMASAKDATKAGIFNNAAQVWNHTFYWNSMKPNGGGKPTGKLAEKIDADFGSFDAFKDAFKQAATTQFGSGWAWLVLEDGKLKITKTGNADLPMAHGQKALLTIDVWEHAYYIDYQNRRPDYVGVFLEHLVNWDFVAANLG